LKEQLPRCRPDSVQTAGRHGYASHCDGVWEHGRGIEIRTLDIPGWRFSINLAGTELARRAFREVKENYEDESEWQRCWVAEGQFLRAGGPFQLARMLRIFLDWASSPESSSPATAP
jgi:hypothetical protein